MVVKLLILNFKPAGNSSVDKRFKLCAHRIEIHGACHNDNVGVYHFWKNFSHIIVDDAGACILASVAGAAAGDALLCYAYLFRHVAVFHGAAHKLIAKHIRISTLARA